MKSIDSFQTTYEELKLQKHLRIGEKGVSFQTTYEELKPGRESQRASTGERLPDYL